MSRRAPRALAWLARLLIRGPHREYVLGDLEEAYAARMASRGRRRASALYLRDVVASLVAGLLRALAPGQRPPGTPLRGRPRTTLGLGRDLHHALRAIRRRPAFALMVVATLALGIGPAAAVFGMVNQLLLRPLPGVANTDRAGYLVFGQPGRAEGLSQPDFDELRRRATLVDGMASYGFMGEVVAFDRERPVAINAGAIYGDFFEVLGARASEGRLLTAAETSLDANPRVAVIGEGLRRRLFAPDEEVAGRTLRLNGQPVEIVGVVAGGFVGAERDALVVEVWLPHGALVPVLDFTPARLRSRESTMHRDILVGMRPGVPAAAVEQQVREVVVRLAAAGPEAAEGLPEAAPRLFSGLHTPPLVRDLTQRTLRMMMWAAALILAISCASVANLLLFRNLARRGALATLRALGASSGRLARQQLAESLSLGLLGGAAGVGVAWLITLPFQGERLVRMPAFEGFTLSGSMIAFVVGAAVTTSLLFGAAPAALAGRFDLGAALRASGARETGRMGPLRAALSAGQISLTLALLVGGLLMVRTIANLYSVETGLDIEGVLATPVQTGRNLAPEARHALHRELLDAVAVIPGVEAAALDLYGPHGSRFVNTIGLPGAPVDLDTPMTSLPMQWEVTPGWFELFGVRPIHGRTFEDADWRAGAGEGVVLTASLARRLFGRVDVSGERVSVGRRNATERVVLGVVPDYTSHHQPSAPADAFFVPYGEYAPYITVLARTRPGDFDTALLVRERLESFFPAVPIPEPRFLTERVEEIQAEQRMLGALLWILSAFGVLMSAVGLYGVVYFMVATRVKELGIRRALGADAVRIVELVARSALLIVGAGAAAGLLVAYPLAGVLQSRLFGVGTLDVTSYLGATALLVLAALAACAAPARAALRVDPVTTLRED